MNPGEITPLMAQRVLSVVLRIMNRWSVGVAESLRAGQLLLLGVPLEAIVGMGARV